MPNTAAAKKALRVSETKRKKNLLIKQDYRSARKVVVDALDAGDLATAKKELPKAYSEIDMASKKGVLHANTAARYKSRLANRIAKAETK